MREMIKNYLLAFHLFFSFNGRSGKKEMQRFLFVDLSIFLFLVLVGMVMGIDISCICFPMLLSFLPLPALTVRRLHDFGRSAWWLFFLLIPLLGQYVWMELVLSEGQQGGNAYGETPSGVPSNSPFP